MITLNDTKRGTLSSGPGWTICQCMDTLEKPHTKEEFRAQGSAYLTQKIRFYSQQSQQNKAPCRAMYLNLRHTENEIHGTKFCTYSFRSPNSLNVISLLESLKSFCKHIMYLFNKKCRLAWEGWMLCVFVRFCCGFFFVQFYYVFVLLCFKILFVWSQFVHRTNFCF